MIEIKHRKKRGAKPGNQNAKEEITKNKQCGFRLYSETHAAIKKILEKHNENRRKNKMTLSKFVTLAVEEKIVRDLEKIKSINSDSSEKKM